MRSACGRDRFTLARGTPTPSAHTNGRGHTEQPGPGRNSAARVCVGRCLSVTLGRAVHQHGRTTVQDFVSVVLFLSFVVVCSVSL